MWGKKQRLLVGGRGDLLVLEADGVEVSGVGDLLGAGSDFLPIRRHAGEGKELPETHQLA